MHEFAKGSAGSVKGIVLRPGHFTPSSKYPADYSHQRGRLTGFLDKTLSNVTSVLGLHIPVEGLARFAVDCAMGRWDDQEDMINNKTMNQLLKR